MFQSPILRGRGSHGSPIRSWLKHLSAHHVAFPKSILRVLKLKDLELVDQKEAYQIFMVHLQFQIDPKVR